MARASRDFESFTPKADPGGDFARMPFDDGGDLRAVAQVFNGLGSRLGQMADRAAQRSNALQGKIDSDNAIGLPEVTFRLKPGTTDMASPSAATEGHGPQPAAAKPRAQGPGADPLQQPARTQPSKAAPAAKGDRAQYARAYYEKLGYSPEQASGIVGNLIQESGLRTNALGDRSIPGGSVGLGQWNRERKVRLMQFASAAGKPWTDFDTQLAFVHHELQTHEQAAGRALKSATSVEQATAAMIGYERPLGWTANNPAGGHGWANRLAHAQRVAGGGGFGGSVQASAPVIGGDVMQGGIAPPASPGFDMVVTVPEPKPLALRRDGTIAGDAYDKAVMENAGWKMQAGLDAELAAAFDAHKDDPAAYAAATKEVADKYVKQAGEIGPEVSLMIKERASSHLLTYARAVQARNEERVDQERKTSALAAVNEAAAGVERQAYLIGINEDGDERLTQLSASAHRSIDAALESRAITPAQAREARERIATGLVTSRIQGVYDALPDVAAKQAFADSLDAQYADPESPLAALAPDTFMRIRDGLKSETARLTREATASSALEKATLRRAIEDDIASLEKTGKGLETNGEPLAAGDVARVLGPEDAADWQDRRGLAKSFHDATSTMPRETAEAIDKRLDELEPKPGEPGFARKQAVFEAAAKRADAILKQRRDDPAAAAEEAFPEIAKEEDAKLRAMKRLDAQAALGIGERARQPLTAAEAKGLSDRIEMVEDDGNKAEAEMTLIMGEAQKTYGSLADDVVVQVLGQRGIGKATAATGIALMQKLNIGIVPTHREAQDFEMARGIDMANDAMAGKVARRPTPARAPNRADAYRSQQQGKRPQAAGRGIAPPADAVAHLKANPQLAPQFDEMYGAGAAELFMQSQGQRVTRKLSDGSWETTYENGFIEIVRPDGSIEGIAPK